MSFPSMHLLLSGVFERYAQRTAVQGRSIAWTYAELDRLSARLAQALRERGAVPGQIVPILMGRSPLLVLSQLAVLRLGAGYSPIDMASPAARRRAMLDAIGSALLLCDGSADVDATDAASAFDVAGWLATQSTFAAPTIDRWHAPPADCPAYVMFTSGSTGVPKGVMAPHAGIVRLVHEADYAHFGPEQRWGFMSSPAFDASTLEVWGALLNGGCCVIQEEPYPSLDTLGEFLTRQRITDTWLTSALFNAMVEDQLASLGELRQLLVGGERVSPQHARLMLQAHPQVRLINGYGPTENTTFTLCHTIRLQDTEAVAGVPIGTPLSGTRVRIEPADPQSPSQGELWIGGAGVALGYLGDAELTASKFVRCDGTRWYRSGDLVRRRDDGVFEFQGRADRQIKLRGQRIELEEAEQTLTRCPGVSNGAVLVVGESAEQRRIVAVYSLLDDGGPAPEELAAQMRRSLPDAAVPSDFIRLPQLPANLNGKVDRKALEAMWLAGQLRAAPSGEISLVQHLRRVIGSQPDRPALEGRDEVVSYAELDRRSAHLASKLCALGVQPGDHVVLLLPRSIFLVVAMLATVRVGAVYAPIDLGNPPDRTARILGALKPRFAVTDGPTGTVGLETCRCIDRSELQAFAPPDDDPPWATSSPQAPMYVMFTSGSTGAPKGVVVPSRGVVALVIDADWAEFPARARWLLVTSPAFDISNLEIWGALLNGACCVVQEGELPSLDDLARLVVEKRISHLQMSTALLNAMVDTQLRSLSGITQLISGGERASPPHMRKLLLARPELRLINAYGPTETTIWSLARAVTLADTRNLAGVPIGRAIRGTHLRLEATPVNDDFEASASELLIGGAGVALGYLHDAEQSALKFVWRDGQRWYRTGDLVVQRSDGECEFHGRIDRQVKIQGQRIEIDEVELALAAFPGVGEVAVLLCGSDAAHRHLVAFYSGLASQTPDLDRVAEHLSAQLPAAAVPRALHVLERLPRNGNGKVDRAALAKLSEASQFGPAEGPTNQPSAPQDEFEAGLLAIWRELLPHAPITRNSHFLRIGGTSLLALHIATRVRRQMGRNLPPVDVLRHPVLADQAHVISRLTPLAEQGAVYDQHGGQRVPMTHVQQGLLAASAIDVTHCAYLVHIGLLLPDLPDWSAWRAAFEALALRHPSLRLSAFHDGSTARGSLKVGLARGWWREHPPIDAGPRDLAWPEAVMSVINRPLDPGIQGSMRVDCWPLQAGGALLVWTAHHHVIDEASIATALAELDALLRGQPLPPVYGSPFGFQAVESAWADSPAAMDQWAGRLAETLANSTPPLERAPAPGRELRFDLPAALQRQLKERCRALGCTPFPLLLTAYGLALQDVFGPGFRFVSTPFSRRAEPELIEPIGYLLDVRFIEAGARPTETPDATLGRVHTALLEAQTPSFQWLDTLIEMVAKINPRAAQCLTQFGFTWRHDPARHISIGGQSAQLLRVPQAGARVSMFLHAARLADEISFSIEAVESAHRTGQVGAVARAFETRLRALCGLEDATNPRATSEAPDQLLGNAPADVPLAATWSYWLGVPEAEVRASSHFLRSGGSSLTAMRMAAALRREHGLRLDVGAFLADPTFAKLGTLARATSAPRADGFVLVGPSDFARVMLVLPGSGGQAAGMYALADALHRRMPQGSAVAVVDLDEALQSAPDEDPLWFVSRRIVQIVRDLGQARVTGLVGFSLGGALALRIVEALGDGGAAIPVWMLDTFAPRAHHTGLWRKVERNLAWKLYGGRPKAGNAAPASPPVELQSLPMRASPAQWDVLSEQLARQRVAAPRSHVRLIQARQSVQHSGLLWQRRNNGFVPQHYGSWAVHEIDGAHLDIPRHLAASTADIIVGNERFDANGPE